MLPLEARVANRTLPQTYPKSEIRRSVRLGEDVLQHRLEPRKTRRLGSQQSIELAECLFCQEMKSECNDLVFASEIVCEHPHAEATLLCDPAQGGILQPASTDQLQSKG